MLSNKNGILNSSNNNSIYMYGAFSGYNTTIACKSGLSCYLECKTSGCIGLTFICDDSVSNCSIDCNNKIIICQ